jgi:hypothetical protein
MYFIVLVVQFVPSHCNKSQLSSNRAMAPRKSPPPAKRGEKKARAGLQKKKKGRIDPDI